MPAKLGKLPFTSLILGGRRAAASAFAAQLRHHQTSAYLTSGQFGGRRDSLLVSKLTRQPISNLNSHFWAQISPIRSAHSRPGFVAQKRRTIAVTVTQLPNEFKMEWPKITLFGDSITRRSLDPDTGCWGGHIAYQVGSYFDVDVRGFEGYNTKWAYEMMPRLFPKSYLDKVSLMVIFFGHNDSWDKQWPMHVPVEEYESNLQKMIKYLEEQGLERNKIILITPTWYHHAACEKMCLEQGFPTIGKSLEDATKYANVVLKVAGELGLDVVDFFASSVKKEPLEEMFCDGVHFSRVGAKMLADQLMPVIEKKIEKRFGKPLVDLWHQIPFDQHPEVKPALEAHMKAQKS